MAQSKTRQLFTHPLRSIKALTQMRWGNGGTSWANLFMPGTRIDYGRSVGDGTRSSVVMACVRWLQRNFAQAPLTLLKPAGDGAHTPVEPGDADGGRMLSLIRRPNPYYHGGALWKATVLSYVVDGNAYWIKVRNSVGAVVQLWWVPHGMIKPVRELGSDAFVDYYEYNVGMGEPEKLAITEVVHFRDGIDPDDTMKGMSAFRGLLREVFTDDEAANYTAALLKNMGVPSFVVSPDTSAMMQGFGATDDDVAETKRKFEQATTGDNRGRAIVMTGATKIQTFGFNPQELSLREARKIPEERVTANIGVPAIVVGLGAGLDRSTFANMSEAREAAGEEALIPMYDDFAPTLQTQLLPDFVGDERADVMLVKFDTTKMRILREDEDKTANRWVSVVSGGLATVKEGREAIGLPVDETHEIYLRPLSLIEVSAQPVETDEKPPSDRTLEYRLASAVAAGLVTLNEARAQLQLPPVSGGDELRMPDAPPTEEAKQLAMKALVVSADEVKRLSRQQQAQLIVSMERDARSMEAAFAKHLQAAFRDLGDHVGSVWEKESSKSRHTKDGEDDLGADDALALRVIDLADVADWKRRKLRPLYDAHYEKVARQTLATLHATIGIDLGEKADDVAVRVLREGGKQLALVNIEEQTRKSIFRALADGKAEGLNPVDIERKIRAYVEHGGAQADVSARAMRIARTETMHAQRWSSRTAYEQSGVYDAVVAWDDRVGYGDPDCVARNQEVYTFEQAEAEEAQEHPNGTLSWAPTTVTGAES